MTFDLDNTLWNTTVTIDIANDVLAKHMNENVLQFLEEANDASELSIQRVETVMGKLFAANKSKYCPVDGETSKSPVLLTQLRKDAILYVLSEHMNQHSYHDEAISNFVNYAFDVWTNARHTAISSHMAQCTTLVLEQIQSISSMHGSAPKKIVIGAITDGNSDPRLIPELSQYFDFCINAEMVGVSKPNKRIYLQAVALAIQQHPSLHDLVPDPLSVEWTDDQLEELVGPWWVHIGDDFVKDIVASKSLNMRSIWTKELLVDKIPVHAESLEKKPSPQCTVEELMQLVNEKNVVEMPIGADNYLADALQQEFADAVVGQLRDVVGIIQQWQSDALPTQKADLMSIENAPLHKPQIPPSSLQRDGSTSSTSMKFCIACGTKLPAVAKFCIACGEPQSV